MRRQPKDILFSAFARMAEQGTFLYFYGLRLHLRRHDTGRDTQPVADGGASGFSAGIVTIPLFGHVSDLIGRRMYMIGAAVVGVFGFLYFAMIDTRDPMWIFAAIVLSLVPHSMLYGPGRL